MVADSDVAETPHEPRPQCASGQRGSSRELSQSSLWRTVPAVTARSCGLPATAPAVRFATVELVATESIPVAAIVGRASHSWRRCDPDEGSAALRARQPQRQVVAKCVKAHSVAPACHVRRVSVQPVRFYRAPWGVVCGAARCGARFAAASACRMMRSGNRPDASEAPATVR